MAALAALAAGAAALSAVGCGAESHPNEARPQSPTRVSVTISENGVIVQPATIAVGPEKSQQIPQNQDHPQPVRKTREPLDVVFVIANQTDHGTRVEVRSGATKLSSAKIPPRSPGTFSTKLETASYTIAAAGVSSQPTTKLVVGPVRTSSENDVLLP
ncbi:MAG TPA: hypothetical protein VMT37_15055 [Solirubrobacterales bacterium]|nr:hypothetical protein [Solirubrobacterales bacterium]